MSKIIRKCFGFALLCYAIVSKKLALSLFLVLFTFAVIISCDELVFFQRRLIDDCSKILVKLRKYEIDEQFYI